MTVGRVPVFYIPWMLWPIKGDRATGLLFPQYGASRKYGFFLGDAFFWAFARNADLTVYGDYYRFAGPAAGVEMNWLPSERGRLRLTGYYLKDNRRDERRYMGRLQLTQPLRQGWRLTADLNDISDFAYYQDFDRTLSTSSSSLVLSTFNLVHNGQGTSFNVRGGKREQFFFTEKEVSSNGSVAEISRILSGDLVQETLPELEVRGRSQRLPGSPLYFSYETSVDYFRRSFSNFFSSGLTQTREASNWGRLDLEPRLSMPLRPAPWLSVEARATLRETYYTSRTVDTFERSFEPDPITSEPEEQIERSSEHKGAINRRFYDLELETIGPTFYRVYPSTSSFSSSYKNVIEPHVLYRFVPSIDEQSRVPIFDDRDPVQGELNMVSVGIRSRLLAKRPVQITPTAVMKTPEGSVTGGTLPWSSFPVPIETPPPPPPVPVSPESSGTEEIPPGGGASVITPSGPVTAPSSPVTGPSAPVTTTSPSGPVPAPLGPATSPSVSPTAPSGPAPAPSASPTVPPGAAPPPSELNPVEVLNVEIGQAYSFGNPLSTRFVKDERCSDGTLPPCIPPAVSRNEIVPDGMRSYGPLSLSMHFNPTLTVSFDLLSNYDLVNRTFPSNSLSGWYRWKTGYVNTTYFRSSTPEAAAEGTSQVRLGSGGSFFNRKLTLDADLGYDLQRSASLDRRGRIGYYTQCCGFVVEYFERQFDVNRRREIRFVVDLKGIGKFLDPNVTLTR